MPRNCFNCADNFCYICGEVTFARQRKAITALVKKVYNLYFGCKIGAQDKSWAPHICYLSSQPIWKWTTVPDIVSPTLQFPNENVRRVHHQPCRSCQGRNPTVNEACVSLRAYCKQVCDTLSTRPQSISCIFRPDIPEEVSWHQTKRVPSFFLVTLK